MMVAALAVAVAGGVAQAPAASTKKSCHWVKATKKAKRHRVCVVKHKKGVAAPALGSPSQSPVAPPSAPSASATTTPPAGPGTVPFADAAPGPEPAAGGAGPALPSPPARLQVTARDFSLALSRTSVPAGALIAELVNRGDDPHDLHMRPAAGGADVLALAETAPGDVLGSAPTAIAAGSYTLYCSLPGHEQGGMRVALTVR